MTISTHILDTARGRPAAGVHVQLERRTDDGTWQSLADGVTDANGRLGDWAPQLAAGVHRLVFDTAGYLGESAFFPEVTVTFEIADLAEHYHVPLLLSPFAYSTYRGS
ncbi:MAG TPA: hydroxyisourate hydrolase [Mycobacteriales bacterium]|nr:hydroxyisourate hydrolase [Mycobacteriales bacterium]